jgi:hypothetical protein
MDLNLEHYLDQLKACGLGIDYMNDNNYGR